MRQIKMTFSEDEANKAVMQIMQQQGKVLAMRPFNSPNAENEIGIAIEYEEK